MATQIKSVGWIKPSLTLVLLVKTVREREKNNYNSVWEHLMVNLGLQHVNKINFKPTPRRSIAARENILNKATAF